MSAERRKHRRVTLMVPAALFLGEDKIAQSGHVQNFSESGASFTSPTGIPHGAVVYFGFFLGDHADRPRCEATGSVVRTLPFGTSFGIGVEFKFADDNFLGFLHQLADSREADRPELLGQIRQLEIHLGS